MNNMNFSLYNLSQSAQDLLDKVEGGTFTEEDIKDTLEDIRDDLSNGVIDLASVVKELDPKIDVLDQHIKLMQGKMKAYKEQQVRIKSIIGMAMKSASMKKVSADLFTVLCKPGTSSVEVTDMKALPIEYIKTNTTESADKTAIKTALNNGVEIEGAKIVTSDYTIQIS